MNITHNVSVEPDEYGSEVLAQLRSLMPPRPLTMAEACSVAERQALRLLQLTGIEPGPVNFEVILRAIPSWQLVFDPALPTSGMTTWNATMKRWVSVINAGEPVNRGRFSAAHELKHALDHPFRYQAYIQPNGDLWDQHAVETVCDYFAGCLLLPRPWVKQAYVAGIQTEDKLADHFVVSTAAARVRLSQLGLSERYERSNRHAPRPGSGEAIMKDANSGLGQPSPTERRTSRGRGAYFRRLGPLAPLSASTLTPIKEG